MKKLVVLLLTFALAVSMFAGCGKQEETTPEPVTEAETPVEEETTEELTEETENAPADFTDAKELRVTWWGSQSRTEKTNEVIHLYEEQNPGITFQPEFSDYSGYWDKLATQAAAKTMPDIIQMDISQVGQYQSKGLLENLNPYIESGAMDLSKVPENFVSGGLVNDEMYVITLGINAPVMIYDKATIEEAGVTLPEKMTWDEFFEIANTINETTGKKTYLPFGNNDWMITTVARGNDETLYDTPNNLLGMADATSAIEHFSYYEKSLSSGVAVPVELLSERSESLEDMPLMTDDAWNTFIFSNQIETMDDLSGKDFGYSLPPVGAGAVSESLFLKPSMSFGVSAASNEKDIAVDFINFFTNSEEANVILDAERGVPINTDIAALCKGNASPSGQKAFDYIVLAEQNSKAIDPPGPAGSGEVGSLLQELIEQVLYGQLTGEEAGEEFFTEGNAILQKTAE